MRYSQHPCYVYIPLERPFLFSPGLEIELFSEFLFRKQSAPRFLMAFPDNWILKRSITLWASDFRYYGGSESNPFCLK